MTNEDLRSARLIEAKRRWIEDKTPRREVEHLADLYESCWTPPPPMSDDVRAMRAWLKDNTAHIGPYVDGGSADGVSQARAYLAGCTRGREGALAEFVWPTPPSPSTSAHVVGWNAAVTACKAALAREGWTPAEDISDDLLAARAHAKASGWAATAVDAGSCDHTAEVVSFLAGCTRAREEAKGLQPCPFCGNAGYSQKLAEYNSFMAGCSDVDCIAHTVAYDFVSEETAISAWNTRVITG